MKHSIFLAFIALLGGTYSAIASAQTKEQWRATEKGTSSQSNSPQDSNQYSGVIPGQGNNLPRVAELNQKSGVWVTWPGFSMLPDGTSQLFLQTTSSLTYTTKKSGNIFIINLGKVSVYLGNNRNPLVTTHFKTPLKRAYFKTKKKKLSLILEMKNDVQPELLQQSQQDGYNYLLVKFPAWTNP